MKYKKLSEVPDLKYAKPGDAGLDLVNADSSVVLLPGSSAVIPTGIAVEIPQGSFGLVSLRSGMGIKRGLRCHIGIIDSGYRGEIMVAVDNPTQFPQQITTGERFAQLTVVSLLTPEPVSSETLGETERGTAGFGSTGY